MNRGDRVFDSFFLSSPLVGIESQTLRGLEMISNMAEQTNSIVIAPDHPIKAGYAYDGSNNLNNANFHPPMLPMNNEFVITHKGYLQSINIVTIDKDRGFSWVFKSNCSIPGVHF